MYWQYQSDNRFDAFKCDECITIELAYQEYLDVRGSNKELDKRVIDLPNNRSIDFEQM